jgi:hypothetical protein
MTTETRNNYVVVITHEDGSKLLVGGEDGQDSILALDALTKVYEEDMDGATELHDYLVDNYEHYRLAPSKIETLDLNALRVVKETIIPKEVSKDE